MLDWKRIPLVVWILFAIDLVLCFSYLINYLIGEPYGLPTFQLDLNGERNIPTWYSSVKWFCLSVLFGIFAFRNIDYSRRKSWLLLFFPLLFLAFSVDEVAVIHEMLGSRFDHLLLPTGNKGDTFFVVTGIWFFVLGIPVLLGCWFALSSLKSYFRNDAHFLKKFVTGLIIFFIGSIGIEAISNLTVSNRFSFVLGNFFEEIFEMVGVTVILWAVYDLLATHGFRWNLDAVEERGASLSSIPDFHG